MGKCRASPAMAPPTRVMTEHLMSVGSVHTGSVYGPRASIGCATGRRASASTATLACHVNSAFVTAASTAYRAHATASAFKACLTFC